MPRPSQTKPQYDAFVREIDDDPSTSPANIVFHDILSSDNINNHADNITGSSQDPTNVF